MAERSGLLTGRGWGVLAITVLAAVPAVALGSRELAVLATCGAVALAVGVVWVIRRPRLEVAREIHPTRVTRGESALGRITVTNRAVLPSAPAVALDACAGTVSQVDLPRLRSGRQRSRTYPLPTDRRGRFTVGPLRLARVDPLGLAHRISTRGDTDTLWVHPRQHPVPTVGGGRVRRLDGPEIDRLPHGTITFHALREYVRGDDLRHVHWRTSARIGELMVREHIDVSVPVLTVMVDNRRGAHVDDSLEEALEVAASLVVAAARENFTYGVRTVDGTEGMIRTGGMGSVQGDPAQALDVLAATELTDHDLNDAVASLRRQPAQDTLVVVTGPGPAQDMAPYTALRRVYGRVVLAVLGTEEAPEVGAPQIEVLAAATADEVVARWNATASR